MQGDTTQKQRGGKSTIVVENRNDISPPGLQKKSVPQNISAKVSISSNRQSNLARNPSWSHSTLNLKYLHYFKTTKSEQKILLSTIVNLRGTLKGPKCNYKAHLLCYFIIKWKFFYCACEGQVLHSSLLIPDHVNPTV